MKKTILVASVVLAMTSAMSQGLGRSSLRGLAFRRHVQLLEPLLPFSEAVEKAKGGSAQGWYALAVHYAKGVDIDRDLEKSRQFMQKASDMNYSNAVFVVAMLREADSATAKDCNNGLTPPINAYLGETDFPVWSYQPSLSITNAADVAAIRAEYERAFNLGVSVATNELARFERRVSSCQAEVKRIADEKKRKAENAKMIEDLKIDSAPPKKQ